MPYDVDDFLASVGAAPRRTGIPLATKTGIPNYVSPEEYAASRTGTGYIQASRDYVFGKGKGRDVDPAAGRYYVDPKQAAADKVSAPTERQTAPQVTDDGKPSTPPASMSVERAAKQSGAQMQWEADPFYKELVALGVKPDVARGAISYAYKNESAHPYQINKESGAAYTMQWLGSRKKAIEDKYGPNPTPEQQAEFVGAELRGSHNNVLKGLLAADTSKQGYDIWGKDYEIPGAAALAKAGVGGAGGDEPWSRYVTRTGKPGGSFSDEGVAFTQDRPRTRMFWVDPQDYINDREQQSDKETKPKRRSLAKSLALGDDIEVPPEFQGEIKGGKLVLTGGDGAQRARAFAEAGGTLMPVAVTGIPKEGDLPKEYVNLRGETKPLDWTPMPPVSRETLIEGKKATPLGTMGAIAEGARDVGMGALRNLARLPGPEVSNLFLTKEQREQLTPEGLTAPQRQQYENLTRADITQATDKAVAERDAIIEARREAAGQDKGDIDWARLGGNVLGTMPLAALGGAGNLGVVGNMLRAGGQGAIGAMMAPDTGDDFATGRLQQGALGILTGAGLSGAGAAAGKFFQPYIDPAAKRLMDMGMRLLPGQMKGPGMRKTLEEQSTSIPFSGAATAAAQRRVVGDFNRAMYDKVLSFVGKTFPAAQKVGREGIAYIEKQLSDAYDVLKPYIKFIPDKEFADDIRDIWNNLPASKEIQNDVKNVWNMTIKPFFDSATKGEIDGRNFKLLESKLTKDGKMWASSPDPFKRQVGYAVKDILGAFRETLERVNPKYAQQLRALNTAWAAFERIGDASIRRAGSEGIFTPMDLLTVEKRAAGKRMFRRGDGLLQGPAQDAERIIGNRYPDSGTGGRAALFSELAEMITLAPHAPHIIAGQLVGHAAQGIGYGTSAGTAFLRGMAGSGLPALRNMLNRGGRAVGNALAAPAGYGGAQLPQQ